MADGLPDSYELFERADRAYAETLRLLAWHVDIAEWTASLLGRIDCDDGITDEARWRAELARKRIDGALQRFDRKAASEAPRPTGLRPDRNQR
jgi:hypothetical protein